jgi:TonB family protein
MKNRTALSFSVVLALSALLVCGARASATSCPSLGSVASHDGHLYVARSVAAAPFVGSAEATFYTATAAYGAHLPSLSVTTPDKTFGYRSETMSFINPGTEPLEAVVITFAQTDAAESCIDHLHIDPPSQGEDARVKAVFDALDPAAAPTALVKIPGSVSTLSCAKPYTIASVDGYPMQPQYPGIARAQGATGAASVRVALNADGSVVGTSIYKSSGFDSLDQSALQAAQATHYRPEIFRCEPIAGAYIFKAEFTARQ